jgi:hypothetical protein
MDDQKQAEPPKSNPLSIINRDKAANLKDLMAQASLQTGAMPSPPPPRKVAEDTDVQNLLDSLSPVRQPMALNGAPRTGAARGSPGMDSSGIGIPQVGMPRCQGYMYKQGHHWHSWKRRWFVLRLSGLEYYRRRVKFGQEIQSRPQGIVPLERVTALQRDVGKFPQPFCFQLVIAGEDRLLAVQCENKTNMEMWIDEINGAIRVATYGTEDDHQLLKKRLERKAMAASTSTARSPKKNKGMRIYGEDSKKSDGPARGAEGMSRGAAAPGRPIVKPSTLDSKTVADQKPKGAIPARGVSATPRGAIRRGAGPRGAMPRGPKAGPLGGVAPMGGAKPPPRGAPGTAPRGLGAIPRGAVAKTITSSMTAAAEPKKTESNTENEKAKNHSATSALPVPSSVPLPPPRAPDPVAPLFGPVLLQKDDQGNVAPQSVEEAMDTVECIGLFFGGAWQQDSLDFTPLLAGWYARARQSGHHLEIVYVSNDESVSAFNDYYVYSMPFLAVPFENKAVRLSLRERLNVKSVPTLVFVDRSGRPVLNVQDGAGDRIVDEDPDANHLMDAVHEMMKTAPPRNTGTSAGAGYSLAGAIMLSRGAGSPGGLTPGNDLPFFSSGLVAHTPATMTPAAASPTSVRIGSTNIHDFRAMDIMGTRSGSIHVPDNNRGSPYDTAVVAGGPGVNYGTYSSHLESNLRAARERNEAVSRDPVHHSNGPVVPVHVPHQIVKRQDRRAARHPELRKRLIEEQLKRPKITARKLAQFVLWLNSLEVWPVPITDVYQEMRNGLMLCNLMMALIPGLKIRGLNGRPRTRVSVMGDDAGSVRTFFFFFFFFIYFPIQGRARDTIRNAF